MLVRPLLAALTLTTLAACTSTPTPPFSWDGPGEEHYRYSVHYQISDEWQFRYFTNDRRINCIYDEPWRDPITAVRLEGRESGRIIKAIDCTDS